MAEEKIKVVVCGSGNAAHAMVGLAASKKNVDCRVFTLTEDEAEQWEKVRKTTDFIVQTCDSEGEPIELKSIPSKVSKKATEVFKDCDIVILTVSAPEDNAYLEAMSTEIKANTIIVGISCQPGFEFNCYAKLGSTKGERCPIVSFQAMPWACRVVDFGKKVKIVGTKEMIEGAVLMRKGKPKVEPVATMQRLFGDVPVIEKVNNFIEPILTYKNIVNCAVLFGTWSDWDGKPLDDIPSFFKDINDKSVETIKNLSKEILRTVKKLTTKNGDLNLSKVIDLKDWYLKEYEGLISDETSLGSVLRTNKGLASIKHPMKCTAEEKFVPDYSHIFLQEDVPYGLVVLRGIAGLAGQDTPTLDDVLEWCQQKMEKEYLKGKELTGKDIKDARAPQSYGYKKLDDILKLAN